MSADPKGKYPYYDASGIVDYVNSYIFNEDLLLISEDGANLISRTYPITFSVNGQLWVNNHAYLLKFYNISTQNFVEYLINYKDINRYITGTAQPKLNQEQLLQSSSLFSTYKYAK